jgi:hypothetical protein
MANAVCAMAKGAARLARAKQASDDLVDAAHRTQADAIEIESRAKIRLAEEYEAAQDRGEVVGPHDGAKKRIPDGNSIATALDLGISAKDIHEGRMLRDASSNRSEASTSRA